jgi:8-amino-7-oxononanoate synthase
MLVDGAPRRPGGSMLLQPETQHTSHEAQEIQAKIVALFSASLGIDPARVNVQAPIAGYGIDSVGVASLIDELGQTLGRPVDPALLWQRPSIAALAQHLALAAPAVVSRPPVDWPVEFEDLRARLAALAGDGVTNPFFRSFDEVAGPTIRADGRELINFASYNYLGLSGHPAVSAAAKAAIDRFGTSVSASRLSSGERALHGELEANLARFVGQEAALVFVGGHATNVSVVGHLLGPQDLILFDELMHNSAVLGARLSGARCRAFRHGDLAGLDEILARERPTRRLALVLAEGVYSGDGDVADLPGLVAVKNRHRAWLMVDEAHSLGVLGPTGRGVAEHYRVAPGEIDILMGTLSKALASCGGFVAARAEIVEYLRYTCPGFVFAAGISPANAAAALAALGVLEREPNRVLALRRNAETFRRLARARGLDLGRSADSAVVPVLLGPDDAALRASNALFEKGVNVQPLVAPAVAEGAARLRFFIASTHSKDQLEAAVAHTVAVREEALVAASEPRSA